MAEPVTYLTVQEVAEIFRRSKRTILRWVAEQNPIKEFTRVRDGVLIPRREVNRILAEGKNADVSDLVPDPSPPKLRKKSSYVHSWKK